MKRFYKFLMLAAIMMALTVPWTVQAQDEVVCENGDQITLVNTDAVTTTTTSYFPGYSFYNYSVSQEIVLAENLEGMGTIYSMQFKPSVATAGSYFNNCQVYLGHTTLSDLSAGFINDTDAFQLVYSGSLNYTNTNWQTIVFDSAFAYDGNSNLVVAVFRNHGSYTSGSSFTAYNAGAYLGRYAYNDNGAYTLGALTGGTNSNTVAIYKFTGCPMPVTCGRVRDYAVSDIQARSFILSWTDSLNSGASYSILNMADSSIVASGITDTFQLVENLTPETSYTFALYADCGGDLSHYTFFSVTTPPACAVITGLRAVTTTGTALLSWTPSVTDPECLGLVQYRVANDSTADWSPIASTTGNTYVISNLTNGTDYVARVAALCENGDTSRWQSVNFTTTSLPCVLVDESEVDSVTVNVGTASTSYYVPIGNYYNYSYTQQLIDADELTGANYLTGIDFQYSASSPSTDKTNVDIYLANTTVNSLANGFVPFDQSFVLVYHGDLNCTQGWNHFDFDTLFSYTGGNLLVVVHDNSGDYNGSSYTFTTHSKSGHARYVQNDNNPYNISSVSGGTSYGYRANMRFHMYGCAQTGTCAAPALSITNISATEATLSWIPGATETSWDIEYRPATDSVWTVAATSISEESYTVQNLVPASSYVFRVVNNCDDGTYYAYANGTTPCLAQPLPFAESFESFGTGSSVATLGPCWYKHYTSTTNYPYPSTSYAHSGSAAMYFYGYSNTYYSWLVLPQLAGSVHNLELSFWEYKTSATYGTVEVGVITDPTDISTFTTVATVSPTNTSMWEQFVLNFQNYNGPEGRIAFVDRTSGGYYFYIDDIEVTRYSTCPRPRELTSLHITHNSAQLSWLAPDANEHSYVVLWNTVNDINTAIDSAEVTTGTTYTLTGLTDSTDYYVWVYTICGDDYGSTAMTHFLTAPSCGSVENLTVSSITLTSAAISWNAPLIGEDCTGYTVTVTTPEATAPVFSTTTPNTYVFVSGLDTATTYTVTVATTCGAANGAAVTTVFTTSELGVIGSSSTSTAIPTNPYYNYSISEQLWLDNELAGYGNAIDSIAFNSASAISGRKMKIYVGNTTLNDLSGSSNVPSTDMTLVYDGIYNIVAGWNWFPFNATFTRTAGQNLVVMVVDSTGTYSTFNGWACGMSPVTSLYAYQDDSPYSTTSLSGLNSDHYRSQVMLGADVLPITCATPALVVANTDLTSISIAWNGNHDSYSIDYCLLHDTVWTSAATNLTGVNTYTVVGLNSSSQYYVRLKAHCGTTIAAAVVMANTLCGDAQLPYVETFDDYSNNYFARPCWTVATTNSTISATTYPYVSNLIGQGPALRLYQGAYVALPHFAEPLNTMQLRFEYISSDTIYPMYFGYMTDPENIQTLVILDTLLTNDPEADVRNFTIQLNTLGDDVDGYLAFYTPVQNPQNYTFIDNLIVELIPTCQIPSNLAASNVTTTTADLTWTVGEGITPTAFKIFYRVYGETEFDTVTVTTVGTTLTGLAHSTVYEVAISAVCSATDVSAVSPIVRFTTECAPATVPYTNNFDNYPVPASYATGVLPSCWTVVGGTNLSADELPQIYYGNAQSGSYSLRMYGLTTLAMPEMDTNVDALQLTFHTYTSGAAYGLVVGVLDSLTPNSAFHPADTLLVPASGQYDYTIYLAAAGVQNGYIAFKNFNTGTSSYSYHYLDDVVVSLAPSCLPVTHVVPILDSVTSITLDWTDPRPATAWEISYGTTALADPNLGTVISVSNHPYQIDSLSDANSYYFYIRTICGAGDSSEWTAAGPYRCHVVNMHANQTDTLYMCGGTIYDDGGPTGSYSMSQNSTIILMPSDGSSLVSVSGYSYTESSFDYLTIYDGAGTSGEVLFRDNTTPNGQSFSNLISSYGPLTLVFHSDGSVAYDGFEVNVNCIPDFCPVHNIEIDPNNPVSTTTATVVWEGSSTSYQIEYGPAGFAHGTGVAATSTTNSFTLTNLEALSNYDFYVRGLCNVSDTGLWHKLSISTPMCDNVTIVENFDTSMNTSTTYYSPIGYALYNYSYVQTLVDAADLARANLNGDITAFAFNAATVAAGSEKYNNMTVYMANVSDSNLSGGWILPDSNRVFVQVIDSASFNFDETGWHIQGFDTPFTWDGQSNVLVSVVRNNGSYASGPYFASHVSTNGAKVRYAYRDASGYNYMNPDVAGTASTTVGDLRFFSCGASCPMPIASTPTVTYNSATINWTGSDVTEVKIQQGLWDASVGTAQVVTTGTITFSDLLPTTAYTIGMRNICEDGAYSDWLLVPVTTADLPCFAPTGVTVTNVTSNGGTITWTEINNATEWEVRVTGTNYDSTYTVSTTPSLTVTGLYQGVTYSVIVRAFCAATVQSEWTEPVTLTPTSCERPTDVAVSVNGTSATVTWNGTADRYEVAYNYQGDGLTGATTQMVTGTSVTLTGLDPETAYEVVVRAYCGEVISLWSDAKTFTTGTSGIDGVEGSQVNLYPNPASTMVTLDGIEGEAQVTLVDMNGRVVYTQSLSHSATQSLKIDLTGMAKGAYFVRITGERTNAIRKLIVK